jgi:hypothetical protein
MNEPIVTIPRALKRLIGCAFELPSGNIVRVTRVEPDKESGELLVQGVYDAVVGDGFNSDETNTFAMTPRFLLANGAPL